MYMNNRPRMRVGRAARPAMGSIVGAVRQGAHDALYLYELKQQQQGAGDPTPGVISTKRTGGMGGWLDAFKTGAGANNPDIPASPPDDSSDAEITVDVSSPVADTSGGLFVSVGGVCKPTTSAMLAAYQTLQRQANRLCEDSGIPKLTVDGAIGANTVSTLQQLKAKSFQLLQGFDFSSCSAVATNQYAIMSALAASADNLGLPSSTSSPAPPVTPTFVDLSTGQKTKQDAAASIGDMFANMSTNQKLVLGGFAAVVAYLAVKKGKKSPVRRTRRY